MQHYNAVVSDKPTKLKVVVKRARNLWHPLSEPNPKVPKSCEVSAKVWIGNDECMSQFTPEKTLTFHGMNADVKFENPAWNCAMLFDITSLKPTENTSQDNTVFVQLLNAPLTETSRAIAVCSLTPDGKLVALNSRQSPSTNPKKGRPSFVQIPRAQGSGDSAVADWFLIHEYRGNGPKVVARCEIELMISLESGNDRPAPFEMKL
jgi:hypothetical protein